MACIYKINGKTFNTTEEIQNYVSSDEFVSVLAKGNSGISKEVRNLILNKYEKTNEVREIEDGQNETKNEGIKSKGKNDGQKTNDVQNEEVTEGGVKAPQVTEGKPIAEQEKAGSVGVEEENSALKDVESTAKALDEKSSPDFKNTIEEKLSKFDKQIAEKKFPSALEVAEHVLPRSIFNKYKALYELAARNNITVSSERLPSGMTAAWAYNNIQINKDVAKYYLGSYEEFAETINHEIIHGLISRGVRDNYGLSNDLQGIMEKIVDAFSSAPSEVRDIISYIQDTRNEFTEKDIQGATEQELDSNKLREVGSLEELITYAFTNSEFAKFLDSIPASKNIEAKGNSIFQQLKNIIRDFISSVTKNPTALDEINSVLDKYFDTTWNESQIADRNKTYEWGLKFSANENIFDKYDNDNQKISEAYHAAKKDDSNPELVKAVEQLLKEQSKAGSESKSSEPSKSDKNYQEAQEVNAIVSKENPEASVLIQPKGEDLSLTAVYVGKEKRGKGIGSKVLESVKKQADKLGKKVVLDATNELDSETDLEKLDNFYKKNGFLKIGENKYEYDPKAKDSSGDIGSRTDDSGTKKSDIAAVTNKGQSDKNVDSAEEVAETSKPKPENVKAIEEAMTKKSGTIKNEIIKEAANPTEVKKILDNLDAIKSKLAGLTTKDGDSVFSEECKWG
jgi:ribosomal protein S18 acetylase RimI-like enzyme